MIKISKLFLVVFASILLASTVWADDPLTNPTDQPTDVPSYNADEVANMYSMQFLQPADANRINNNAVQFVLPNMAAEVQNTEVSDQPNKSGYEAAENPSGATEVLPSADPADDDPSAPPEPIEPPPDNSPLPPDTTTEPEGCAGPAHDQRCVDYQDGGTRTITHHQVNTIEQIPTHSVIDTVDHDVSEHWDAQDGRWEKSSSMRRTDRHIVSQGYYEALTDSWHWENTHDYKQEHFVGDSAIPESVWEYGDVDSIEKEPLMTSGALTVARVRKYTYTYASDSHASSPSLNGYEDWFAYNVADALVAYGHVTYENTSSTEIARTDSDSNGTFDLCNKTVTVDGNVVYAGACADEPPPA